MKRSRKDVVRKATKIPRLKFEHHRLTSFAGLVVFQRLFHVLQLRKRFSRCLDGQGTGKAFPTARLFLQLIVHLLIGFRELRHADCYRDDPLVQRVLGFEVMPDVATLSRMLKCANAKSVSSLKKLLGDLVLARFIEHPLARITLDFDGSVQSTKRRAQGTAVGYNKKTKRSSQLLSTVLHNRPDRTSLELPPSGRQRTRLQGSTCPRAGMRAASARRDARCNH